MSPRDLKPYLSLSWKKGFIVIAYFLLIGTLNVFIDRDWPFIIFAWPFYLFPRAGLLAAIVQVLFVYALGVITLLLIERPWKK